MEHGEQIRREVTNSNIRVDQYFQGSLKYINSWMKIFENSEKLIDDNVVQVKNIFKVIADEIANIKKECGYKPQVIVLEHADEEEFNQFIKYRRSRNDKKLV